MFQCSNVLAWTPPQSPPPQDNVPQPLNTGPTAQGKTGSLGIGTDTPTVKLDVLGIIESTGAITSGGRITGTEFYDYLGGYLDPGSSGISLYVLGSITATGTTDDNYFLGNLGIGTTVPDTLLTIANDNWISAKDNAGTSYVNMFKVNASDEIDVGGTLNVGPIDLAEDSGAITLVNLPVSSTPSDGDIESYGFSIDSNPVLTIYGLADGIGGADTHRIGIGTTSPQHKLDVRGEVAVGVAGATNQIHFVADPTADTDVATKGYVDGAGYWGVTGSYLYPTNLNYLVGIGIATPSAKLEIDGGVRASEDIMTDTELKVGANTWIGTLSAQIVGNLGLIDSGDLTVAGEGFFDGEGDSYFLGNLGIGISAPTKGKLEVDGNIAIGGSNNELRFYEGVNYVGFEAPALTADKIWVLPSIDGSSGQVIKTDGAGNLSWISHNGLDGLDGGTTNEYYHLDNTDYTALSDANAQLGDLQTDGSPSFNGLTIGTLSGVLKATTGVVSGSATMDDIDDGTTYVRSHNDFTDIYKGYLNQGVRDIDDPIFAGLTVDTDTIYVDSTNHFVGIGTTEPGYELDVQGTIYTTGFYLNDGNATAGKVLVSANTSGLAYWQALGTISGITCDEAGSCSSNYIPKFITSSTVNDSIIYESGGQIGIGTVIPQAKLHVDGSIKSTSLETGGLKVTDSPGLNKVLTDLDGAGTAVWTDVSGGADNDWVIVGTDYIYNYDSLNRSVGIGTTNPGTAKLAVMNGNVGIGTTTPNAKLQVKAAVAEAIVEFTDDDGTDVMQIDANGNVIISL